MNHIRLGPVDKLRSTSPQTLEGVSSVEEILNWWVVEAFHGEFGVGRRAHAKP